MGVSRVTSRQKNVGFPQRDTHVTEGSRRDPWKSDYDLSFEIRVTRLETHSVQSVPQTDCWDDVFGTKVRAAVIWKYLSAL